MSAKRGARRFNAVLNAMMFRELMQGPCSANEIMVVTGIARRTTASYLRELHRAGCLHIVEFERDKIGRQRAPIYALGEGEDVQRKKADSWSVTTARYQARQTLRIVERLAA